MRRLSIVLFLLANSFILFAQDIPRSTFGMTGSSCVLNLSNIDYYVSQSVGQSSLIGTLINNELTARQGFQQPFYAYREKLSGLDVKIYPNPVDDAVNIVLSSPLDKYLYITLYDIRGSVLLNELVEYDTLYSMDISFLSSGAYILKLLNGNQIFISQILKQ